MHDVEAMFDDSTIAIFIQKVKTDPPRLIRVFDGAKLHIAILQLAYMRRVIITYARTKVQISCAVTVQLISTFVFTTQIVQSLYFLNPKFHASSHLVWLYSSFVSDLVGNPVHRFSRDKAHYIYIYIHIPSNEKQRCLIISPRNSPADLRALLFFAYTNRFSYDAVHAYILKGYQINLLTID